MIYDKIENATLYSFGSFWDDIFCFIKEQNEKSTEQRYELSQGIYASIESYQTKSPKNAVLESHRRYVDIQWVIQGAEEIHCASVDELEIHRDYNEEKDFLLYQAPINFRAQLRMEPGFFAALWPNDAHRPQLRVDSIEKVKKGVIKIPFQLFEIE